MFWRLPCPWSNRRRPRFRVAHRRRRGRRCRRRRHRCEPAWRRRSRCGRDPWSGRRGRRRGLRWRTRRRSAEKGEAGVAGGERALVGQSRAADAALPTGAAVIGGEDLGAAVELVADDDAVLRIPESDGVEEAFGVRVGELKRPVLAGVAGLVDAGFVAGPGAHQIDRARVDGADAAEIQRFGARDFGGAPRNAAIGGHEPGAAAAAGPYGPRVDRADAAQRGAGVAGLWRPGLRPGESWRKQRGQQLHVFTMVGDCACHIPSRDR